MDRKVVESYNKITILTTLLDTHGNGIAESSWLTNYYNNSCRYRYCDDHDVRAMLLVLEFFFYFFFDQGIGSRSAAWASRVDVV